MKKHLSLIARIAISLILLWLVYQHIDFNRLRSLFANGRMEILPLIYVLLFVNTVLNCMRWRVFLKADGQSASLHRLVPSLLIAGFLNTFLPSVIGGDFYRVYDLSDKFSKTANALASVVASRLVGYMALTIIGIVFAFWGVTHLPHQGLVFLPLAAFVALGIALWLFFQQRLLRYMLHITRLERIEKINRLVEKFLQVFALYRRHPAAFIQALGLGLIFQLVVITCIYLMARTLGLQVVFFHFCVFVPMITLIEMIPITIFGLGLRDGAYAFFFGAVGMPKEDALSIALFYVMITISYSLIGGVLLWLRMGNKRVMSDVQS